METAATGVWHLKANQLDLISIHLSCMKSTWAFIAETIVQSLEAIWVSNGQYVESKDGVAEASWLARVRLALGELDW